MKTTMLCLLGLAGLAVAGCSQSSRSISHSEYPQQPTYYGARVRNDGSDPAFEYRGELSEFDVLGITKGEPISEADIRHALEVSQAFKLRPGSSILLIQSGALFPDESMVTEMSKHFRVVPFSGVPSLRKAGPDALQTESNDPESYSKSLRLTAARGGTDFIVCYWGVLESESDHLATKTVSWVPVVNWLMPDEKQHMRIQLKVALVDVRSGNWTIFSPKAFEDARSSTSPRRGAVDQKQVERLKTLAYQASVAELTKGL